MDLMQLYQTAIARMFAQKNRFCRKEKKSFIVIITSHYLGSKIVYLVDKMHTLSEESVVFVLASWGFLQRQFAA
jgi:hypothetical protein